MKIRETIEYGAVTGLLGLCRILPESWVYGMFRGLGHLCHALLAKRRNLALRNTEIAFPEKPLAERRAIVRRHFVNLTESLALNTLIMCDRITNEQILAMVEADNWKTFETAVENSEKGLLIFSAHLGNWELVPQYASLRLKKQIHVISRKGNNELIEQRIVRPLRERFGVNIFYKKNAIMNIRRAFRNHEPAGLLIDQRLNLRAGISVPFFGRETGTTATPALLQLRFGATTMALFMVKSGHRKYRLIVGEPVQWQDNGKPFEEQVAELTRIHQSIVEDAIRAYPDQWFWVHDRWKK